jgi:hypothetical protein
MEQLKKSVQQECNRRVRSNQSGCSMLKMRDLLRLCYYTPQPQLRLLNIFEKQLYCWLGLLQLT